MTTPTTTETKFATVANLPSNLVQLAGRANEYHELAKKHATIAVRSAIQCGALLREVRAKCQHGEWMSFLEAAGVPETSSRRYIAVAEAFDANAKLLTEGKSLCDLYRELGLVKPAAGGGNRLGGEELARRRAEDQLTFHFDIMELAFKEVARYAEKTGHTNPFESLDRPTLDTTREQLVKALALVDEALAAN